MWTLSNIFLLIIRSFMHAYLCHTIMFCKVLCLCFQLLPSLWLHSCICTKTLLSSYIDGVISDFRCLLHRATVFDFYWRFLLLSSYITVISDSRCILRCILHRVTEPLVWNSAIVGALLSSSISVISDSFYPAFLHRATGLEFCWYWSSIIIIY